MRRQCDRDPEAQAEEIVADNNRGVIRSITRAQATQIVLVLLGMLVLFTIINPDAFLSVFNFRSIIVNASIFIILGVGVTFVIVTAGIDLSIGSVLVFASVMSAMVMESLGTEGWAIAAVGAVVAVLAGALWGLNGFYRQSECSRLHRHAGHHGYGPGYFAGHHGGIDLYNVPEVLVTPSASRHRLADPHTRGDRTRDRRIGRHIAAQDQVRALHLRPRLQHGGVGVLVFGSTSS